MGPGSPDYLTRAAAAELTGADIVLVDDLNHPVGRWLSSIRSVTEANETVVGLAITTQWGDGRAITVGVSGSPTRDNAVVEGVVRVATNLGVEPRLLPSLSILDLARCALPQAGGAQSIQVLGSGPVPGGEVDHGSPFRGVYRAIDPTRAVFVELGSAGSIDAAELRRILELYPSDHQISAVTFDASGVLQVRTTTVQSLNQSSLEFQPRGIYIKALDRLADRRGFDTLSYIVARLRAPDGCPWDREQDYRSIKKHMIEEAYEAVAAIDDVDLPRFCEELGDVLLQVMMYSQLAREAGDFTLEDVLQTVNDKLVRRHPHVFGEVEVKDSSEVLKNWEQIKKTEQADRPGSFSGVPDSAPALMRAEAIQSRAERHGWQSPEIMKTIDSIEAAGTSGDARFVALGDVLFDVVAIARRYRLDPEEALRLATNRFRSNFDRILADQP